MNKSFLPYDIYERHRKVASLIPEKLTVLDVGGELNHLSQFLRENKIIVANLDTGDVIIKKDKLPFENEAFDIVCAIDVLEHIPSEERQRFIKRSLDVAREKVILSFPLGTKKHYLSEHQLKTWLKKRNQDVKYLEEHITYGLPTIDSLEKLTNKRQTKVYFSGNVKINEFLFKIFMFDPKFPVIRNFIYYLKLIFNLITNPLLYSILVNKTPSEEVNRAYLVVNKNNR